MIDPSSHSAPFEQHREFLQALAYRLLGAASDAEDIVQETYLRWVRAIAPPSPNRAPTSPASPRVSVSTI